MRERPTAVTSITRPAARGASRSRAGRGRERGRAREQARAADSGHQHHSAGGSRRLSLEGWSDVAHNFRGDWQMLWKEISLGFAIAGFIALLPIDFFHSLF